MSSGPAPLVRTRRDLCPGVRRPWPADDGGLVRLRLVGGRLSAASLASLSEVAQRRGDGLVHTTARANLQLRGLPLSPDGSLPEPVVRDLVATGLVPSLSHELVRNVMLSPLSGLRGGRVDLRPVAAELDALLCGDPALAALPGRFLFVLDDGRGDLAGRPLDLGLVALSAHETQLRIGASAWGPVVPVGAAAAALVALARAFLAARGSGVDAPWHVDELDPRAVSGGPLAATRAPDPRAGVRSAPLELGGPHVAAPSGVLGPALVAALAARGPDLVVTPWHGVLVCGEVA